MPWARLPRSPQPRSRPQRDVDRLRVRERPLAANASPPPKPAWPGKAPPSTRLLRADRPPRPPGHVECSSSAKPAPARSWWRGPCPGEPARRRALRPRQLRGAPGDARGERALRPREGRLHGRRRRTGRACSAPPTAARSSSTSSASLPLAVQPKLLRVLQEGELRTRRRHPNAWKLDVRLVAATNRDLAGRSRSAGTVPRGSLITASTW